MTKIVDCTFRDGGYYTDWNFSNDIVLDTIKSVKPFVDIIELGFKSPIKGGRYRHCSENLLEFIEKNDTNFSFMVNINEFMKNNKLNYSLLKNNILHSDDSLFSTTRAAVRKEQIDLGIEYIDFVKDKGYFSTLNLIRSELYTETELSKVIKKINKSNVDVIYLADSLGSFYPNKLRTFLNIVKENTDKKIGFHAHNNLSLAFANSLMALECGVDFIDGSVSGIGRGAGNLPLEQLLMYNEIDCKEVINLIDLHFKDLHEQKRWGVNPIQMLSGFNRIHPSYVETQKELMDSEVFSNLCDIRTHEEKTLFNPKLIKPKSRSVCVVIPARYKSTRFPGKPIVDIAGVPMVIRVAKQAEKVVGKENVFIATEDKLISDVVSDYDYNVVMTSDECLTGTDRVAEVSQIKNYDIILNIQGDEPLIDIEHIQEVINLKKENYEKVITLITSIKDENEFRNNNVVKFLKDEKNHLVYASRSPIPGDKKGNFISSHKHVSVYAFTYKELKKFYDFGKLKGKSKLEYNEDVEILRFLDLDMNVYLGEVLGGGHGVDVKEDIEKVEQILLWDKEQSKVTKDVIAIDFDGVIHKNSKGYHDGTIYDEPVDGAIESIKKLSETYKIVLFTFKGHPKRPLVNGKDGIELCWDWLKMNEIDTYIDDIVWGKPNAKIYIDDKGYKFENWNDTLRDLNEK
tara:strand:- start:2636 stop:4690 length:2055 start_codon:yes stop_codon:yes gene_type:complete